MKILQFGKFYYPTFGGMERAMFEITEGLNDKGVECDVLCSNTKLFNEESFFGNYTVYRTASYGILSSTSMSPNMIVQLWKRHKDYDVIDVHHPDPMAFLALFIVRPKTKLVIHWQSDIVRQQFLAKLFLPLQNWVLKRADRVILASETYGKHSPDIQNYLEKMEVVPIGIEDKSLQVDNKKREEIRSKYSNRKIILALGRLVTYKGFDNLVEAANYLDDDYIILIGGTGPEEESLTASIENHHLQERVKMLGYISEEEKYAYFDAATLFCLPSVTKAEAFGVVLIEAMAFGKPIVLSNIEGSGMNWVNQEGVTGLQVEPRDPKVLAQAIKKICSDRELYQLFSDNATQRFQDLFKREKMIDSLIKLYSSII
ncbi:MAG: glycosyltransferase [Campylobacterota bacterium]|nr:glycosyltransferase [Campylobacterota bacterium]